MSQENESLHIKFDGPSGNEVVIRHGQAEPIHTPGKLSLSGKFGAPAEFVKKRMVDSINLDQYALDNCHVIFDEKNLSITLVAGEQERDTITVSGSLKKNPFLETLKINGSGHTNKALLELIRYKPHFFASREEHKLLVKALQKFEVKTSTDHVAANDRQGTIENRQFVEAKSDLTGRVISLRVPFFEGQEAGQIDLIVEIEPNNGSVLIFLISETFEGYYEDAVKALFDTQRATFEPFVIIEK